MPTASDREIYQSARRLQRPKLLTAVLAYIAKALIRIGGQAWSPVTRRKASEVKPLRRDDWQLVT
jgi:hypothetical protein